MMQYLRNISHIPLTLEAAGAHIIKWWADASYLPYDDMKSHAEGVMTFGKGDINGIYMQQIYSKSSTESELVIVNDIMPQIHWTSYFLESRYTTQYCIKIFSLKCYLNNRQRL